MATSQKFIHEEEETGFGTPSKYVPVHQLYSSTRPSDGTGNSSSIKSKKMKQELIDEPYGDRPGDSRKQKAPANVDTRSSKRSRIRKEKLPASETESPDIVDLTEDVNDTGSGDLRRADVLDAVFGSVTRKRAVRMTRKADKYEPIIFGVDSTIHRALSGPASGDPSDPVGTTKPRPSLGGRKSDGKRVSSGSISDKKRWVELGFEDVEPTKFVGLKCKVYWPSDAQWYTGWVVGYSSETNLHQVQYEDGEAERLMLSKEKVRFYLSRYEMQLLELRRSLKNVDIEDLDYEELFLLAAGSDKREEPAPGDIIWAKLAGHPMWPAIIMNDEAHVSAREGLKPTSVERSVTVQFFGTHDFSRISRKQAVPFLRGLLSSVHLKCKQTCFHRSLEEAKVYLSEQKLPQGMLRPQSNINSDDCQNPNPEAGNSNSNVDVTDERLYGAPERTQSCPTEFSEFRVINIGKIVRDSHHFQNGEEIWPEGYIAERKFTSISDPTVSTCYKMEVLRDPESRFQPLFRVTADTGEKFIGETPSACWEKIYRRIKVVHDNLSKGVGSNGGFQMADKSGSDMFGFLNPKVFYLIQKSSSSMVYPEYSECYRPVHIDWKDLDKCSICYTDEEFEDNLFLQCDKCRMMVHAGCYGEPGPVDGVLWLCNLCRPGIAEHTPICSLCPVIGGALKPTTDGRWAHLVCAIWIPETCILDVDRMEPIDGLGRIHKDRWKLLCSFCGVSYGACIQCSNRTCCVAYHPLCARAAGLCGKLEDENQLHVESLNKCEDKQRLHLLSFCKRHRQPSNERHSPAHVKTGQITRHCSNYNPPINPSGCARTEPYDFHTRRGRKEPEALAAASLKRLYVENRPYLVTGYCQNGSFGNLPSSNQLTAPVFSSSLQNPRTFQIENPKNVLSSVAEKYHYMRKTLKKRLTFGKSRIHGFGLFAKQPHRAGDLVIEYTGEIVRPPIADRREHFIYNSFLGAGTCMFRMDDKRIIDATRAGSIALLINHSCEPNCYSRVITLHGDDHIIIMAKRDINKWEELTYDYRYISIDEQPCYCGFPRCRGVVNETRAKEQMETLCVHRSELIDFSGE